MSRHRGQPAEPAQPGSDRLQRRQAVTGRRPRRALAAPGPAAAGSSAIRPSRSAAARPANRDRHDHAVDAGTSRRLLSRPASHGRAAARPAAAAAAASISTAMTTAAPYRRRDHKTAGSSTCVRPQPRHLPRRGQNSSGPLSIATTRRRAQPHRASTAPQHGDRSRPAASRASTLPAEPRTVITVVPPPAPPRRPSPDSRRKRNTGRAAAITDMATVTPSSNPRITNPANHTKTTSSTALTPHPVDILNGGRHPVTAGRAGGLVRRFPRGWRPRAWRRCSSGAP